MKSITGIITTMQLEEMEGTDGYYTFGEAVPIIPGENGHAQSSYFFVSKYDFELNTVWQRKFIFRKDNVIQQ